MFWYNCFSCQTSSKNGPFLSIELCKATILDIIDCIKHVSRAQYLHSILHPKENTSNITGPKFHLYCKI